MSARFEMQRLICLMTLAYMSCPLQIAHGHGIYIKLVGNKIVADVSDDPVIDPTTMSACPNTFFHALVLTDPMNPTSTLFADHGSISGYRNPVTDPMTSTLVTTQSGLTVHNPAHANDDKFYFDVLTPLFYADGVNPAANAPAGITMEIKKTGPTLVNVTESSHFQTGFGLIGRSSHETQKRLYDWAGNDGAYAFGLRIRGETAGGAPFITSDPLFVVLTTPALESSQFHDEAVFDAYSAAVAAVPEPSAFVLCGSAFGIAGLAWLRQRRYGEKNVVLQIAHSARWTTPPRRNV